MSYNLDIFKQLDFLIKVNENVGLIKEKNKIYKEICEILDSCIENLNNNTNNKITFKFNNKRKKMKKHFPFTIDLSNNVLLDNYIQIWNKPNNNVSFSLSNRPIIENLKEVKNTATNLINTINIFNNKQKIYCSIGLNLLNKSSILYVL
jgi:hypothetical protein